MDEDPTLEHVTIPHQGCVNRVRAMPQAPGVLASLSGDTRHAHIFDASSSLRSLMSRQLTAPRAPAPEKPVTTFRGHREEGFALDWSSVAAGKLITGDCAGAIHVWSPSGGGAGGSVASWSVDAEPYRSHTGSVEDLQWSPGEAAVFASCSADRTVRVWDTRGRSGAQITLQAHSDDVNVISWNKSVAYLLASGCDDGSFKVGKCAFTYLASFTQSTHSWSSIALTVVLLVGQCGNSCESVYMCISVEELVINGLFQLPVLLVALQLIT